MKKIICCKTYRKNIFPRCSISAAMFLQSLSDHKQWLIIKVQLAVIFADQLD